MEIRFYGPEIGGESREWDLNDWKWDGDLFTATPLNPQSRQLFPVGSNDIPLQNRAPNGLSSSDLEKRKRRAEVNDDEEVHNSTLNLKLGGQSFPVTEREVADDCEDESGKKTNGWCRSPSSRAICCQVDDCKADLSKGKDYHRRHKVCGVHSKAINALVGNVLQRFCQQCSRFHDLQEFDEGKRSCRRRLAGHNKRRRKTHIQNTVSADNELSTNNLLIGLLRLLSNLHSSSSIPDQTTDQDLLSRLLENLANRAGSIIEHNPEGSLTVSRNLQHVGTSLVNAVKDPIRVITNHASVSEQPALHFPKNGGNLTEANASVTTLGREKAYNIIDLNSVYDGSQDNCMEDLHGNVSLDPLSLSKESRRFSPPHNNSGVSGSSPSYSPSTSSDETQSRTDKIVFKLFGKDPSDFPIVLRKQILDWLSCSPTDIESYIRPGCVVLTIYVCMDKNNWQELHFNLNSSLRRLVDSSNDLFWRTGWIYTQVQHRATFLYNGHMVLDSSLPINDYQSCKITSVTPIAVSLSDDVRFVVKGLNLSHSTSRLLCALEGKYLVEENCADVIEEADSFSEHEETQCLSFSCVIPNFVGRGFIEIEDHGLSSTFFPFIVAEKDICSEICNLESVINDVTNGDTTNKIKARDEAFDFIHEMGWLLHKSRLMYRLGAKSDEVDQFPIKRFRWLIEFAVDHDWCAVLKKLLNVLFDGAVCVGSHMSVLGVLLNIGILHQAVRRKSGPVVRFLLEYRLNGALDKMGHKQNLFRPDTMGPGGVTPLHLAASMDGCDDVLDALTDDPGSVGIEAWKNIKDDMGFTPYDYACLRGHYSYIHLVQRKSNKNKSGNEQVVVDIPDGSGTVKKKKIKTAKSYGNKVAALEMEKMVCMKCDHRKSSIGEWGPRSSVMSYRPAMVSMVVIAAVCVCAALLFKTLPEVYPFKPFCWELLKYGPQ